jgi:hypothetical protein
MEDELLLTQRLILQPEGEANLYGKTDPARQLGSELSDLEIGLRVRSARGCVGSGRGAPSPQRVDSRWRFVTYSP